MQWSDRLPHFWLIDTEASGLDPEKDHLLEIAVVGFDPNIGVMTEALSVLVSAPENPAEQINGIPAELVRSSQAYDRLDVIERVKARLDAQHPDPAIYVAHNAAFDRQWLGPIGDATQAWLCTHEDACWPRLPHEHGSLINIALAYGVGVVRAHRAIEDCLTLAAVLSRVHEIEGGLEAWWARARELKIDFVAEVGSDDDRPKLAGFRWDRDASEWRYRVRESIATEVSAAWPFLFADASGPSVELEAQVSYSTNRLAKDAGFRWDPERKIWHRTVRESLRGRLEKQWPFRALETRRSISARSADQERG